MSALGRAARLYEAPIGKKAVMALTGVILVGFLIGHVVGNLQIFSGPGPLNKYAEFLHHGTHGFLWVVRAVLVGSVVMHVKAAVELYRLSASARPVAYQKKGHRGSTLPSRVMLYSGFAVAAFLVFHILHFTTGHAYAGNFVADDVYQNMVGAFRSPLVAGVYVVAVLLVAMHLSHGMYSLALSLGLGHPRWTARARAGARVASALLAVGFASIPIAVLVNLVK